MEDGIDEVMEFEPRIRVPSLVRLEMDAGMEPVIELVPMFKVIKAERCIRTAGRDELMRLF